MKRTKPSSIKARGGKPTGGPAKGAGGASPQLLAVGALVAIPLLATAVLGWDRVAGMFGNTSSPQCLYVDYKPREGGPDALGNHEATLERMFRVVRGGQILINQAIEKCGDGPCQGAEKKTYVKLIGNYANEFQASLQLFANRWGGPGVALIHELYNTTERQEIFADLAKRMASKEVTANDWDNPALTMLMSRPPEEIWPCGMPRPQPAS